jgi:phosphopantothenoylcysteine decarboxylase/phosphopantothenate--cysteine ligase
MEDHARAKLEGKKLDMIVANRVGDDHGFDKDDNAATVLWKSGKKEFPRAAKVELARELVDLVAQHFYAVSSAHTEPRLTIISNID